MVVFGWVVFFLIIMMMLAFNRATIIIWTVTLGVFLIIVSICPTSAVTISILWILWACFAGFLNIFPLRRALFSNRILELYRKAMPPMSLTEREALSAGTVGWEGDLFSGMPNWTKLIDMPKDTLSAEEQAFLDGPVEDLCSMINNWEINQKTFEVPTAIWDHLKKHGFFGLIIPKEYGGKEFSALAHSQVITKITSVSIAVGTIASVPNSLGPAELLLQYGTEEQKTHYLPRLAKGEEIPCFALTSPEAGSDASSIVDHGVICRRNVDGEEKLGILLNWNKRYITLSPVATLLGLAFKLYDPDHLIGEKEEIGITCALIPVVTPGVITGRRHFPLRCAFPNGPTQGKDVFIPMDWIIGGPKMAGHGWRMLMECLAAGRSISLPSMATGGTKRIFYATGAYARIREQFNIYIGAFGGIQEALARVGAHTFAVEATRLFTVAALDRGEEPAVASAISKYYTTQTSRTIINDAMDIHGGKGICMGPHNYIAQTYFETPISITVEGANILTRCMIIFGQGAVRCHPFVLQEIMAAKNEDHSAGQRAFDKALFGHLCFIVSNKVRAFLLGISKGYLAWAPKSKLRRYYQQFSQFSAAFALVADAAMLTIGGALKRKEKLSARLGDLLIFLYVGSAAMKYYELLNDEEGLPLVRWLCEDLLYRMQLQLNEFLINMPNRWLAWGLRMVVFPLGQRLKPPSDHLTKQVAELLIYPSKIREKISQHLYTKNTAHNPIGLIASVLEQSIAAEPLEKKLRHALREKIITGMTLEDKVKAAVTANIFTAEEGKQLISAYDARLSITNVDDFASEDIVHKTKE